MKIMGIDPGYERLGWGLVDGSTDHPRAIAYGCLTTKSTDPPEIRLAFIFKELKKILLTYQPDQFSVEELFFAKNAKTAMGVSQARGVVLLAAGEAHLPVISYTPIQVKLTICGSGKAEKIQVQKMVTRLLHLREIPKPDDTADALAIALTHLYSHKLKGTLA